jgi:hypothetical protein
MRARLTDDDVFSRAMRAAAFPERGNDGGNDPRFSDLLAAKLMKLMIPGFYAPWVTA